MRSLGYIVHAFASAEEFLGSPHLNDTSCVIADVQMPAMSGLELQARLLAEGYRLPFIFITAFSVDNARVQALKAGAICFLAKPFAGEALIDCLHTALQGHGDTTGTIDPRRAGEQRPAGRTNAIPRGSTPYTQG